MKKKVVIIIILVLVLGIAYYALSPLFRTTVVNDPLPENKKEIERATNSQGGFENLSPAEQIEMEKQMDEMNAEGPVVENKVMLTFGGSSESFSIMHTVGHPAEGTMRILQTQDGTVIRFENFKTINGPELHIYLAKDLDAKDYVDLGPIRGTEGNINYDVPADVDISEYKYVLHWCVPFGVLFNFAEIRSSGEE